MDEIRRAVNSCAFCSGPVGRHVAADVNGDPICRTCSAKAEEFHS